MTILIAMTPLVVSGALLAIFGILMIASRCRFVRHLPRLGSGSFAPEVTPVGRVLYLSEEAMEKPLPFCNPEIGSLLVVDGKIRFKDRSLTSVKRLKSVSLVRGKLCWEAALAGILLFSVYAFLLPFRFGLILDVLVKTTCLTLVAGLILDRRAGKWVLLEYVVADAKVVRVYVRPVAGTPQWLLSGLQTGLEKQADVVDRESGEGRRAPGGVFGIQKCPECGTRVIPTSAGKCPACGLSIL